jgi:Carboxypeptidase regulatory-like domain
MRRKIISGLPDQANFLTLLALLLFAPALLHAQAAGAGSIQGTVIDASSATISGASVTLTNDATLVQRQAVTDDSGLYTFPTFQSALTTSQLAITGHTAFPELSFLESSIGDCHQLTRSMRRLRRDLYGI